MVPQAVAPDLNSKHSCTRGTIAKVTPEPKTPEDGKDVDMAKDYEYSHYKVSSS